MSSLIQVAAYFSIETPEAGRIVRNDEALSPLLFSKEEAYTALRSAHGNNLINKAERDVIEQQIDHCSLPRELSKTMKQLRIIKDAIEEVYQLIEGEFSAPLPVLDGPLLDDESTPEDTKPTPKTRVLH